MMTVADYIQLAAVAIGATGMVNGVLAFVIRANSQSVKASVVALVAAHEAKDMDRHIENVTRLTRLETLIKNGH